MAHVLDGPVLHAATYRSRAMPTTSRPLLSPDDTFVIHVSTLARQAARRPLILHNLADPDDIAQDATLDCLAGIRSGTMAIITTDIVGFVRMMVIRRALGVARAADRRDARAVACVRDEGDVYGCTSPETRVEHDELVALIELTVASLPPMCRRVFQMVREDDASYSKIALTLGISCHTVKEHLTAAQRRLRAALVDAAVIAPPLPRAGPHRMTTEANEVPGQRPDPAANLQDSAA